MQLVAVDQNLKCFHCGDECGAHHLHYHHKDFCCTGCKSVFEILSSSGLTDYYKLEASPGSRGRFEALKFTYLDSPEISLMLLDFSSDHLGKIRFSIPAIHCSSCIWLLENLHCLHQGVLSARANLGERELAVDYDPRIISLRGLAELLATVGYEPAINLDNQKTPKDNDADRSLLLKIAVAGFCFGNIMLLSFPEYIGLGLDQQLSSWFTWIAFALSIPVLFYCSSDYFKSAVNGLKQNLLNIDVPIALGILALAVRSYYEVIFNMGSGYMDSLAGLLFLLLIGRWFQQKTYGHLSFTRDFKSYFPLAVTRISNGNEQQVLVEQLQKGDVLLIRNSELVPTDCILLDDVAGVDYSFVNGESKELARRRGSIVFAGGRHLGLKAHYQVQKPVSQSYLTQLWNHHTFGTTKHDPRQLMVNAISRYFTAIVLFLALSASLYWLFTDPGKSVFVFISVLIVACPCALAMATPFTLGTIVNVMGRNRLYLKNAQVVDKMAAVSTLVFDKTGTLTKLSGNMMCSENLDPERATLLAALAAHSNHPVSRNICLFLGGKFDKGPGQCEISNFHEITGKGISGRVNGKLVKIGNAAWIGKSDGTDMAGTYASVDGKVCCGFQHATEFRDGLEILFENLKRDFKLALQSGDSDHQKHELIKRIPWLERLNFRQTPFDKLEFISDLQRQGEKVMMLGDGLNDAGALQQSDVGVAVTENTQHFTPASDAILHAGMLPRLPVFLKLAKWSRTIILIGFVFSVLYNLVGLSFAISGNLTPLIAAVLMPLSSISIVIFSTLAVKLAALKLRLN